MKARGTAFVLVDEDAGGERLGVRHCSGRPASPPFGRVTACLREVATHTQRTTLTTKGGLNPTHVLVQIRSVSRDKPPVDARRSMR